MKYGITLTVTLLICCSISLRASAQNYIVKVAVKKYPSNAVAFLQYKGLGGEVKDSVAVGDGNFSFTGTIDEPRPASIILKEPGKKATSQHVVKFYIQSGEVEINSKSMLFNHTITGSPETLIQKQLDKLTAVNNFTEPDKVRVMQTSQVVAVPAGSMPPRQISMGRGRPVPVGTTVSKRIITDINELPYEVQNAIKAMREESRAKVMDFIAANPKSFVSLNALHNLWELQRINYAERITLANSLDRSIMESNQGKAFFPR